jgi:uncharacterized Zn-binding protein involved in type VI secretion
MQNAKNEQQQNPEITRDKYHPFATVGSTTERGGRIAYASSGAKIAELAIARVGDKVVYEDGSEAYIIDGAGFAAVYLDKPLALVGSRLSNGDRIVKSLHTGAGINERAGHPIVGLFDPDYLPPPANTEVLG